METDDSINGLPREAAWRGPLTADQARQLESWWAAHPEERRAWEEEVALTRLLARLPDAAAPSNLTARVLSAIDERAAEPEVGVSGLTLGWLRTLGWLPRLVGVAVLVVAGYVGRHQYQTLRQEAALARSLTEVSELATAVPSVEVLQDFKVIRNLGGAAVPDEELLALLQ